MAKSLVTFVVVVVVLIVLVLSVETKFVTQVEIWGVGLHPPQTEFTSSSGWVASPSPHV